MTLSSTTTKSIYNGDGSTIAFSTGFRFIANSHVTVILRDENVSPSTETTWVENTQYTLTGAGEASGGTVTVKIAPTDYTPQSGEKLTIKRTAPETQGSAFPAGGAFPSSAVEQALDQLTMLIQAHSEEIARALVFATTSPSSGVTVPEPAANRLLGWNSAADDLENKIAADLNLAMVSPFVEALMDDVDAATARATLELGDAAVGTVGVDVQPYDADTLKADTPDVLTAGFAATTYDAGTKSSGTFTLDEANGNMQKAINGGAHTLAPPTNDCTLVIQYTNNASAGAVTTSDFTLVDGDPIGTADGDDYLFFIVKINGFAYLNAKALPS